MTPLLLTFGIVQRSKRPSLSEVRHNVIELYLPTLKAERVLYHISQKEIYITNSFKILPLHCGFTYNKKNNLENIFRLHFQQGEYSRFLNLSDTAD